MSKEDKYLKDRERQRNNLVKTSNDRHVNNNKKKKGEKSTQDE